MDRSSAVSASSPREPDQVTFFFCEGIQKLVMSVKANVGYVARFLKMSYIFWVRIHVRIEMSECMAGCMPEFLSYMRGQMSEYISGYISEYLPEYRSEIISLYEEK